MVRFGVSPIAWTNDDMPALGANTPVETIFRDVEELGFDGIELGGRFSRDPATLSSQLAAHGLALVGGWWSSSLLERSVEAEIDALQKHLQLLKTLGSTVFIMAECSHAIHGDRSRPITESPRLQHGAWRGFGVRLRTLADYLGEQGLRLAYHFHLGTVVEREEDLEQFFSCTDERVGLTVDTGHAALGGIDAEKLVRSHPTRIAHIHAKDVRRRVFEQIRSEGRSFLDGVLAGMFTAPGDGDLRFDGIMRALHDIGYAGWIVIEAEQDPALADPRTYSRLGLVTVKEQAALAGLLTPARMGESR